MRGTLVRPAALGRPRLSLAVHAAALVALLPLALYVWTVAHRVGYGYEFDWLEGGAVELVARVVDGRSLYAPPTLRYVPYPYPPLYSWLCAAVAEVTGVGFLPLRIVSIGSSLVAFAALGKLTLRATGDRAAAIVAVGLLAATYGLSGWWFDIGRVDSLFVALTLVALWLGRDAVGARAGVVLGLITFLACFTKQAALIAMAPALAVICVTRWRAGVSALLALAVLGIGSTLILDATTGGWYRYYILTELAGQAWVPKEWLGFWQIDLYSHLRPLALVMLLAVVAGMGRTGRMWQLERGRRVARELRAFPYAYELAAAVGLFASAWFSRLHTGGYVNVLMPAYAAAALLGAIAFATLRRCGGAATLVAALLVTVQMTGLVSSFSGAIPTAGQAAAGAATIAALRALPGPVLVLGHPWYGTLAGKGSFAQQDAILEVLRSDGGHGSSYLRRGLSGALKRDGVRAVVLDGPPPNWLAPQLAGHFTLRATPLTAHPLRGFGGVASGPELVYLRLACR